MKLAEALAERTDCQKRLEELRDRLEGLARIQEGEQPAEDPSELLSETDRIYSQLLELISPSTAPIHEQRSIMSARFPMPSQSVT